MSLEAVLYRKLPGDDQVRDLDPVFRNQIQQGNITPEGLLYTVPERHLFRLDHTFTRAAPAVLRTVNAALLQLQNPQVSVAIKISESGIGLGAGEIWIGDTIKNPVWLTPGCSVSFIVTWDAADPANTIELGVTGMLFPLGNVERI